MNKCEKNLAEQIKRFSQYKSKGNGRVVKDYKHAVAFSLIQNRKFNSYTANFDRNFTNHVKYHKSFVIWYSREMGIAI